MMEWLSWAEHPILWESRVDLGSTLGMIPKMILHLLGFHHLTHLGTTQHLHSGIYLLYPKKRVKIFPHCVPLGKSHSGSQNKMFRPYSHKIVSEALIPPPLVLVRLHPLPLAASPWFYELWEGSLAWFPTPWQSNKIKNKKKSGFSSPQISAGSTETSGVPKNPCAGQCLWNFWEYFLVSSSPPFLLYHPHKSHSWGVDTSLYPTKIHFSWLFLLWRMDWGTCCAVSGWEIQLSLRLKPELWQLWEHAEKAGEGLLSLNDSNGYFRSGDNTVLDTQRL